MMGIQRTCRNHLTTLSVNYLIIRVRSLGINQRTGKKEKLFGRDFDRNVNKYYYDPMSIAYDYKIDFDGLMTSLYNNYHSGFTDLADTDRFLECFQLFDKYNSLNIQSDKDCAHLVLAVSMTNRNPSFGENETNRLRMMNLYSKYTRYDQFRFKEEERVDYKYKRMETSILSMIEANKEMVKEGSVSMQRDEDVLREVDDIISNTQEDDLFKEIDDIIMSKQKDCELREIDEIISAYTFGNDSFKTATFGNYSKSSSLTINNGPNYPKRTDNTRNQLDMEMRKKRSSFSSQSQKEPDKRAEDSLESYLKEIGETDHYFKKKQSQ